MNSVVLHGDVSLAPRPQSSQTGTQSVYFGLELKDLGKGGKTFSTYVDCITYGENLMRTAQTLQKGDSVLIMGKLVGRKKNEVHTLAVMPSQITVLSQWDRDVHTMATSVTKPLPELSEVDIPF
jgi:hypothetical protein